MSLHITTPFGRRSLTPAQIRAQVNADGCPSETIVHKWTVFRDIATARASLGLTDRSLAVLDALLTFHPETALSIGEGPGLVVYPSNAVLALRAHGIAEATLRRALAALVEAGLVIRRDSPNGKRYVRRGQGGAVAQAYGFDLSPLVARAAELGSLAEAARAQSLALRTARERVTLLRRDCIKLIQALEEAEGAPGTAEPLRDRYRAAIGALPRAAALTDLEIAGTVLAELVADVGNLLTAHCEMDETIGNPDQNERHIHNSNPENPDSERAPDGRKKAPSARADPPSAPVDRSTKHNPYPLGLVLDACPDIAAYSGGGIRTWRDLIAVAGLVRSMLGISLDAWREACEVMGEDSAAITISAILQRAERIQSPGGYLRALVDRKRSGQFSLGPVLQALNREKLKPKQAHAG